MEMKERGKQKGKRCAFPHISHLKKGCAAAGLVLSCGDKDHFAVVIDR